MPPVVNASGNAECGLRVFVLPAGFVAAASTFAEADLSQNLRDLTFESMTSPSTQRLFRAHYEFALGAENAFADIARSEVRRLWKELVTGSFASAAGTNEQLRDPVRGPFSCRLRGQPR